VIIGGGRFFEPGTIWFIFPVSLSVRGHSDPGRVRDDRPEPDVSDPSAGHSVRQVIRPNEVPDEDASALSVPVALLLTASLCSRALKSLQFPLFTFSVSTCKLGTFLAASAHRRPQSDDLSTNFLPQPLGSRNVSRSPRFAKSLVRLNIRCVTQCAFKEPDVTLVQRSNRSSICFNCAFCSRSLLAS
jgi:hypothetical protein